MNLWKDLWTSASRVSWQIRCTSCGKAKPMHHAGGVRYGASGAKFTLGWCRDCRRLRVVSVERVPAQKAHQEAGPNEWT